MANNSYLPKRVMVIVAHPDDIEFGCAGTVARWVKDGAEVCYVLVTSGDVGIAKPDITRAEAAAVREAEQLAAAAVVGVLTLPGLIISLISIAVMWALVLGKRKVGRTLDSAPILADANCTMVCIYMSIVLLVSSLVYELTGFGFIDSIGALGLIYFSYIEGRETFKKAAGMESCCDEDGCEMPK